jgi:TonB family protein
MPEPKAVVRHAPRTTEQIKGRNLEGMVSVRCIINQRGSLEDCCIAKGVEGLDLPVIEAVREWRFEPFVLHGEPVNLVHVIGIRVAAY